MLSNIYRSIQHEKKELKSSKNKSRVLKFCFCCSLAATLMLANTNTQNKVIESKFKLFQVPDFETATIKSKNK